MADPRAFISFDFDNNLTDKNLFVGQIKNSRTPFRRRTGLRKNLFPNLRGRSSSRRRLVSATS